MNVAPLESVLSSLESGARPKGGVSADSGEIPSLGGEHVNSDGGFDFTNIKRIPRSFFETMRGGRIAQSDILVVKDGATTGKTSFVRHDFPFRDAAVNEHVFCVRVDSSKASPAYVYHFLRSERGQKAIQLDFRGATVGGISREFATKTRIPLPPLAEQRRIAEVLDRVEALRAKRRAALAQLDSLTQSLFLDLFGDPAANTKHFPTPQLAEAIELRGGFAFKSGDYVPDGIPLVRIGEVNRGGVTRENACFLPVTHEAALARFIVRPGDMLMSLTGTTGKDDYANVILLDRTFDRYFVNQRVALIEPKPNVLDSHYLLHVFRNPKVKARLTSKSRGIRQANISNGDVLELELPVPPISLQREFARRVTAVEALKTAQRTSLAELDVLFSSLQHRAFRGEL